MRPVRVPGQQAGRAGRAYHGRAQNGHLARGCAGDSSSGWRPRCGRFHRLRRTAGHPAPLHKSPGRSLALCALPARRPGAQAFHPVTAIEAYELDAKSSCIPPIVYEIQATSDNQGRSLQEAQGHSSHQVAAQDALQDRGQATHKCGTLHLTPCCTLILPAQVQVCRAGKAIWERPT